MNLSPQRLVSWVSSMGNRYQDHRRHDQDLQEAIELVVDAADPDIRRVGRYRKSLQDSVTAAMQYCTSLVDDLPGPVRLSRSRYYADPLVKAVFVSDAQMMDILKTAMDNNSLSAAGEDGREGVALLTMTRTERTMFGHTQQGDMMVADVAKRTVNFIDHRIVALSTSLSVTKEKLQSRALEVLATVAMERIATIRGTIAELRERKVHLQSMHKILKGRNHTMALFAHPTRETSKKIETIKQQLAELERELQEARGQLATPADALTLLKEVIGSPASSLVLQRKSFRVDWMNVLLDEQEAPDGNDISLAEFSVGELQRWAVMVNFCPEDVQTD